MKSVETPKIDHVNRNCAAKKNERRKESEWREGERGETMRRKRKKGGERRFGKGPRDIW